MIISSAYIQLVDKRGPIKAKIYLGSDDLIESCEITGGEVYIGNDADILFKDCFIANCRYKIKEFEEINPPCPTIDSCIIKDCQLPEGYYISCVFENKGRREYSRL
jgi:hypothetical protein